MHRLVFFLAIAFLLYGAQAQTGTTINIGVSTFLADQYTPEQLLNYPARTVRSALTVIRALNLWRDTVNKNGGITVGGVNYTVVLQYANSNLTLATSERNVLDFVAGVKYGKIDAFFPDFLYASQFSANAEAAKLISIHPYAPTLDCQISAATGLLPAGCTTVGQRRAQSTWGLAPQSASYAAATMSPFRTTGAKTFYIVNLVSFSAVLPAAMQNAGNDAGLTFLGRTSFPGPTLPLENFTSVLPTLLELDPDVLVVIGEALCAIWMNYSREANYMPRGIVFSGCTDRGIAPSDDIRYIVDQHAWNKKFRGSGYYEGIEQYHVLSHDKFAIGPALLDELYFNTYNESAQSTTAFNFAAGYVYHNALTRANSFNYTLLKSMLDTTGISTPVGRMGFDAVGRSIQSDVGCLQIDENATIQLLAPLSAATMSIIYPMPHWNERVFNPHYLDDPAEIAFFTLGIVFLCYIGVLIILICVYHKRAFIRHATPLFCVITLVGGLLLIASSMLWSLYVTSAMCIASVWVFNIGATLILGAMLTKTWRVFRVFMNKEFRVVSVTQIDILKYLSIILALQLIMCIIWTAVTTPYAETIVVDKYRPSNNYLECHSDSEMVWMGVEIGFYGTLMLLGVVLAFLTRNVPSSFNEARIIGFSFYAAAVGCIVVVAVLLSNTLDHYASYILRTVGIQIITVVTLSILFVPKFWQLKKSAQLVTFNNKKFEMQNMNAEQIKAQIQALSERLSTLETSNHSMHTTTGSTSGSHATTASEAEGV